MKSGTTFCKGRCMKFDFLVPMFLPDYVRKNTGNICIVYDQKNRGPSIPNIIPLYQMHG